MNLSDCLYRASSYLRHRLTARNTLGYGVHSPYLYNIVHFILYDNNRYYCFSDIEQQRQRLLRASKTVYVDDFGTLPSSSRRLSDIASSSLMPASQAQLVFRLANFLRPDVTVELGTNLGITASYLAVAASPQPVYTFEGSPSLISEAQSVWNTLKLQNINAVQGNIDLTLPDFLAQHPVVDFAIIDANHTFEATLRYFSLLARHTSPKSVILIDDIHHNRPMAQAWKQIVSDPRVTSSFDFYHFGVLFFDPQLLRKNYRMNI